MDKKYTFRNIILSLVILVVAYIYCLVYAPSIEKIDDDSLTASIANVHKMCFYYQLHTRYHQDTMKLHL